MQLPMYTAESANWYALINKAQAAADYYFHPEVENYLVYVLAVMSGDLELQEVGTWDNNGNGPYTKRERKLMNTRKLGERSLIVSGLFPDHANRTGVPLVYLVEKGQQAYTELSKAMPDNFIYAYFSKHFTKVIDVLQVISDICGHSHSIDLIQACELWQETGSKHSLSVIRSHIGALPASYVSGLCH